MTSVNFAVHADTIIPVSGTQSVLNNYSIVVQDGLIKQLLPSTEARQLKDLDHVELPGHVLMPGLVNAHGHAAMTLLRGYADDMPLSAWLNDKIWPLESQWVSSEFVSDGTDLAAAEMLLSGITTSSDMYFFPRRERAKTARSGSADTARFPRHGHTYRLGRRRPRIP
jgi:5-methylthioadenosine/S-adenosylhomocysteine deaminase